ncbi:integrase core domain-containing protein [Parapedomonas caeni]
MRQSSRWHRADGGAGRPRERCCRESFSGSIRDECCNGDILHTLADACRLIEAWRRHHNTVRSHGSLSFLPPSTRTATQPWPPSGAAPRHRRSIMAPKALLH